MKPCSSESLYAYGLALLTYRERSEQSLLKKLAERGGLEAAKLVLDRLVQEGWASDRRFVESYIRYRAEKGFGPLYIKQQLFFEGVSSALSQQVMFDMEVNWDGVMEAAIQKKIKNLSQATLSHSLKAKIQRFLVSRGFEPNRVYVGIRKLS